MLGDNDADHNQIYYVIVFHSFRVNISIQTTRFEGTLTIENTPRRASRLFKKNFAPKSLKKLLRLERIDNRKRDIIEIMSSISSFTIHNKGSCQDNISFTSPGGFKVGGFLMLASSP